MEHNPLFAVWINRLLKSAAALVGIPVHGDPLPAHVIMAMIVTLALVVFFKLTVKNLTLFPAKMQTFLESIYLFFRGIVDDMIGTEGRKFIPVLGTLGLFIALSNLLGLLPEMASPTSQFERPGRMRHFHLSVLPLAGGKKARFFRLFENIHGTGLVAGLAVRAHRDHLPFLTALVADRPTFLQYFRRRPGDHHPCLAGALFRTICP